MTKKCDLQKRAHTGVGCFSRQKKEKLNKSPVEGTEDTKNNK